MNENPLLKLRALGQSIWMDYISGHMINSGELRKLIHLDQVTQQLEDEGVEKFNKPYDSLLGSLAVRREAACSTGPSCGRGGP